MTIDKTKFLAVINQITNSWSEIQALSDTVNLADPENTFGAAFSQIYGNLTSVEEWANQKILEADQETVMNGFLSELKVVFDKYAARMEVGSDESGYGTNYGGGNSVGVKFVATLDGVTASKEINKAVIVSGDLE